MTAAQTEKIPETLKRLVGPIDELKPYPRNFRQGDVGAITVSLEANGQFRPIVVNRREGVETTNTILAGNHTWLAAQELGWRKIARTFVDVDDNAARKIAIADNRHNDLATNDDKLLADELTKVIEAEGAEGLLGTGFDGDDVDELLSKFAQTGDAPQQSPPDAWQVVIECDSEQQQTELLERLESEGLNVRALVG